MVLIQFIRREIILNNELLSIYFSVTLCFGSLAALSAFIITYTEQKKNLSLPGKERIIRSLETALISFIVLSVLTFFALFLLFRSF